MIGLKKLSQITKIVDYELLKSNNDKEISKIIFDYLFERCNTCNHYDYYFLIHFCS